MKLSKTEIQDYIIHTLPLKPNGRVLLAPRAGKTRIAVKTAVKNYPEKILYVTLDSKLAKKDLKAEFETWGGENIFDRVTSTTWKSLHKISGHFPMVIFDEDQHITEKAIENINIPGGLTFDYCMSMSGTPTTDVKKLKLFTKLGIDTLLYELSIDEAVIMGILAEYEINVVYLNLDKRPNYKKTYKKKEYLVSEYTEYLKINGETEESILKRSRLTTMRVLNRLKFLGTCRTKTDATLFLKNYLPGRKMIFCHNQEQASEISPFVFHGKTDDKYLNLFCNEEID